MSVRGLYRGAAVKGYATPTNAPVRVDSSSNKILVIPAGSGSTELELQPNAAFVTITGDGAVALAPGSTLLTKGSAAAITIAAPGTLPLGTVITIIAGSAFAHVVTFTGSTLQDGVTGGGKITWTSAAFVGSSLVVEVISATAYAVISKNLGTIA